MDHPEFRALLHRYQQGECTPTEKARVEEWYARLGKGQSLALSPEERSELVSSVWQRISEQTTASAPANEATRDDAQPSASGPSWPSTGVRWAAVALLALGTGAMGVYLGWDASDKVAQAPAQPSTVAAANWRVYTNTSTHDAPITLPDGSAIALAPASTLRYPRSFTGSRRNVYLTGAAFFQVYHDAKHPFLVYTEKVVTTVLGTSFRVEAYAGRPEVQVQVKTGKVQVTSRGAVASSGPASLFVLPNQQAVYSAARQQLRREVVAQPALLKPQSFVFEDRPVAEVLAALEKAYGVAIVYDAAAVRNCTLNLGLADEPLFAKLDIVCEALGASYEKADGRIIFHSQPCQVE